MLGACSNIIKWKSHDHPRDFVECAHTSVLSNVSYALMATFEDAVVAHLLIGFSLFAHSIELIETYVRIGVRIHDANSMFALCIEKMKLPHVTHLTLGGGGLCGLAYLGCIRFMDMENMLNNIRHISGTSIGAFFGCALALNMSYIEIESAIRDFISKPLFFDATKLLSLVSTLGVDDGDFLIDPLKKYVQNKYGTNDITFLDLTKATGKYFVVCATCVETMKPTYFSVETTPTVGILEAVQASMSVPLFVRPKKIGDAYYCDGAVTDNIPYSCFKDVLSLLVIRVGNETCCPPKNIMSSFPTYIYTILHTYCSNQHQYDGKIKWLLYMDTCPLTFLPIKCQKDGLLLHVTFEDLDKSIVYGYSKMQEWINLCSC